MNLLPCDSPPGPGTDPHLVPLDDATRQCRARSQKVAGVEVITFEIPDVVITMSYPDVQPSKSVADYVISRSQLHNCLYSPLPDTLGLPLKAQ